MRHSLLLSWGLLAGLSACAQRSGTIGTGTTTSTTPPPTPATPTFQKPRTVSTIPIHTFPGDTALVFQRTPCYGTCPAYTATVFRSGKVSYQGERFVPVLGEHTLSLPPATVQEMVDKARALNFNGLAHEYRAKVTDQPGILVTSYLPGQKAYRVAAERGAAPAALQGYLTYLQTQLDPLAGLEAPR